MFECEICGKGLSTQRELQVHKEYLHGIVHNGQHDPTQNQQVQQRVVAGACPDCGSTLYHQEGCVSCPSCGFSKC